MNVVILELSCGLKLAVRADSILEVSRGEDSTTTEVLCVDPANGNRRSLHTHESVGNVVKKWRTYGFDRVRSEVRKLGAVNPRLAKEASKQPDENRKVAEEILDVTPDPIKTVSGVSRYVGLPDDSRTLTVAWLRRTFNFKTSHSPQVYGAVRYPHFFYEPATGRVLYKNRECDLVTRGEFRQLVFTLFGVVGVGGPQ